MIRYKSNNQLKIEMFSTPFEMNLPTLTVFICKIMIINLMPFWLGTTVLRKLKEKFSGYLEGNI